MSDIERPAYAKNGFPAPSMRDLNASLPSADVKNPFSNGGTIPMTKFSADRTGKPEDFSNSSSNPQDMPLPHGQSYSEFTQTDEGHEAVVTNVVEGKILRGSESQLSITGQQTG